MFPGICISFGLLSKGLVLRKSFYNGYLSEQFTEEWRNSVREMDNECYDLLLEELCKKLSFDGPIFGMK